MSLMVLRMGSLEQAARVRRGLNKDDTLKREYRILPIGSGIRVQGKKYKEIKYQMGILVSAGRMAIQREIATFVIEDKEGEEEWTEEYNPPISHTTPYAPLEYKLWSLLKENDCIGESDVHNVPEYLRAALFSDGNPRYN